MWVQYKTTKTGFPYSFPYGLVLPHSPILLFVRGNQECIILHGQEWMNEEMEKWRDEVWSPSCIRLRFTPARWFLLMTRGPEFLWLPWENSCCHPQLLHRLWRKHGSSWAGYTPAKQSSNSGMGTDRLVVPAGWLSLPKPYPANYSFRMPS